MTVQNCINDFLITQQIRGNSDKTVLFYSRCLGFFAKFNDYGSKEISRISVSDCQQYYLYQSKRNISSVTLQSYIRALRAFLNWCFSEEYTSINISEKFRLPKAKRNSIDVLTDTEIKRLLNCFDKKSFYGVRNNCIISLMLDSGLRLNEVVTLKCCNIHIAEGYIIVDGKGNKQRFVPLGLNSKKSLMKYSAFIPFALNQTHLFVKDDLTTPITSYTVNQLFRRLKKRSNIPRLHPHLLRHTFATRFLLNGGDIYSLQMILGHSSLEMVKKYVHLTGTVFTVNFSAFSPIDNLLKKWKKPEITVFSVIPGFPGDSSGIRTPDTLIKSI